MTRTMHKSFVTTAPTYREGWRIAGLMCRAITFRVSSQCRGKDTGVTLGSIPQGDFLLRRAGKEQSFDLQFAPEGGAYSKPLNAEKS